MLSGNEVLERILAKQSEMSKAQQKIAKYIIEHPETAPFLTASKLAKKAGVGEATVVRFATFLGYTGYPHLQKELQETIKRKLTTVERLAISEESYSSEEEKVIYEILNHDVNNLRQTMQKISAQEFKKAVQLITDAPRIYIVAYRSAVSLGLFLEFYLDLLLQNTELIRQADGISERLLGIAENDVVIGISYERYTRRTVEVMKYVYEKGAKTIALTDHELSPLIPYAHAKLIASSGISSFIDSFTAPLSVINALITAVSRKQTHKVRSRLENLESLWAAFRIFYTDSV